MRKFVFFIVLVFSLGASADIRLPNLGVNSSYQINKEAEIGRKFYQRLSKAKQIIDDSLINYYLQEIIYTLLQGLDSNVRDYKVAVIDDGAINAFAVPGGFIGVNYGLLLAAETEAQLAGVLAHEIAHIKLSHVYQMIDKQENISSAVLASLFLAILLNQSSDGADNSETVEALVFASNAGAMQSMINFTRENEYEADRKGLDYMKKSGYPPIGMAEFFSLLEGRVGGSELASIEYLRTHPVATNRVGEAYQLRESKVGRESFKRDYEFFKVYLNHVVNAKRDVISSDKAIVLFKQALKEIKENQHENALKILKKLYLNDTENTWIAYSLINLEITMGRYDSAFNLVNQILSYNPHLALWQEVKVSILLHQQKYKSALKIAEAEMIRNERNQRNRFQLVRVYEHLGFELKSIKTKADYHYIEGNLERAKYLYQLAKERSNDKNEIKAMEDKIIKIKQKEEREKKS